MKPAPFKYVRAETVDHALDMLAEYGSDARVIAGGQSLVPMMSLRLVRPAILVDIARTPGLSGIVGEDAVIRIGATACQSAVLASDEVRDAAPVVCEALRHVGHPAIRNRGTIGGSIAHADPAAELPAVALALDAQVVARRSSGDRVLAAHDFFRGYFETALEEGELLTELRFPACGPHERTAFLEVARRHGDYALVGVVVRVWTSSSLVEGARIVVFGVAPEPTRVEGAEDSLVGAALDEASIRAAAGVAAADLAPRGDVHASGEYRKSVAEVLVRRALQACRGPAATP
jgi:carbon-monoxide dehydrogenase medium subunit